MRPETDLVLGGRYVLRRWIATGGMGEVWEAIDRILHRPVAVKILKDELRVTPAFIERFRAEARHAGGLSHPGIASVYDYGEAADFAYLVMELVPGQTLSELLVDQPQMPTATKLSILSQAAEALHAAHVAGVVHRDVKTGNLLIGRGGTVKVTDFGIARAKGAASLTEAGEVIGTAQYMSPEQATGEPVTPASDVYSLGVVGYEMFAGQRPFERDTPLAVAMAHVHEEPPPLPAVVPQGVRDLISAALAKDPRLRPPSAAAFAARARNEMAGRATGGSSRSPTASRSIAGTAVQPVAARSSATPRALTIDRRQLRRREKTSLVAPLALVVLLLVAAGTVWVLASRSDPDRGAEPDPPVSAGVTASITSGLAPAVTAAAPDATTAPSTTVPTTVQATIPAVTAAPAASATSAGPTPAADPVELGEQEAVAFVRTYYDQIEAGELETTWAKLTPEFRAGRDLTYAEYASYWGSTSLDLDNVRYSPGPGADHGRVRFDARYTVDGRIIEETDEITVRREVDGRLVITEQRRVA